MSAGRDTPLGRLERALINAALARYKEHRKFHGPKPDMSNHTAKAQAMYHACRKLYEASNGK